MPMFTLTASAKTPLANYASDIKTREAMPVLLDRGFDMVFKREFEQPLDGEKLIRVKSTKRVDGKITTFRAWSGVTPINRDADEIPYATKGEGFGWDWKTFNFRQGIAIEKTDIETDEVGTTKGGQRDLILNFRRSVEYNIADHYNRAFGVAGAPVLADDGCYMIDSDRPNPNPAAPAWSNLEATSDLTEDALFTAYLNRSQQISEDGHLYPQKIKKMMIPPSLRQKMWKLLSTANVLGSNNNDANWAASMFKMEDVIVYDYLTTSCIFYLLADAKSEDNELVMFKRVEPSVNTGWGDAKNPDVMYQRLRASYGIGLGSPRKYVAAGLIVDASE